ncbi:MAG: NHL repeat-containing protein, partial [Proteobacteria bacterium]|nr:NHL repeat-containing protein [Pseudomonadota bacterium]
MTRSRFQYLEIGRRLRRRTVVVEEPIATPAERTFFRLVETIGSFGADLSELTSPGGLAVDSDGNLYIADTLNNRIQKITPQGDVYGLGGDSLLLHPCDVAVDNARFIYVVEQGANRIQKFGPKGQFVFAVGGPEARWPRFASPTAIFLDSYHHVYVADSDNNRITSYTATGRWLTDYHGPRPDLSFARPQGVAVDAGGFIYVADTMHHRILRLTLSLIHIS